MEDIFKQLNSPSWWIGVVVVGIIINITSVYLKTFFEKSFSKISSRYRIRYEKKKHKGSL